jgi:hypothetical protein
VLYIPGYDPFPARRYRELYRSESAAQAAISGYRITLGRRAGKGFGWTATALIEGARVEAEFQVLIWSDIVRRSMDPPVPVTYWLMLRTAWIYLASGALVRLGRLRKGPLIAALFPVMALLLQAVLAVLAVWLVWGLLAMIHPWLGGVSVALAPAILLWFRRRDGRIYAYYLIHDYAFSAALNGANSPALEGRMASFADRIADALDGDVEEVLVVGHSSGAHLAVSVVADLLRAGRVPAQGPALSLLTLGQVIPMMSFLPDARRLRADLRDLSLSDRITWLDVTAPGDGCAFALCDPVAVSGVAPQQGKRWPLVISVAFTRTLSPERWKALRWRVFRLHFQYLCAFDRPGDYDYFRVTAGPMTLGARYAGRAPSPSRVEAAVSPHVSRAAIP